MFYRVWNAINRPAGVELGHGHRRFVPVPSAAAGYAVIEALRARQDEDPSVLTSEFGLEVLSIGSWKEWYDDGGLDVMERFGSPARERRLVPI
jgi:hypothetical protein